MIVFINEESAYRHWVTHHREGFVLDGWHKPSWKVLNLHRAVCSLIKVAANKRTHWTTGSRFKACSIDRLELEAWAAELGGQCKYCNECSPAANSSPSLVRPRLSPLSAQIVDYVLEVAAIHFEDDSPAYQLTIGMIASCMNKSPRQMSSTLQRLFAHGYLESNDKAARPLFHRATRIVYPTALALRMLPYFQELPEADLLAELAKLRGDEVPATSKSWDDRTSHVRSGNVNAEYEDGVLTITLPKCQTARSRRIVEKH